MHSERFDPAPPHSRENSASYQPFQLKREKKRERDRKKKRDRKRERERERKMTDSLSKCWITKTAWNRAREREKKREMK